jgi:hypothetical protein
MSEFEDNLWHEVMREYGRDLARAERPVDKHRWRARPQPLAGTTAGVAAVATTAALLLGAASSSPAFAVTRDPNGTVTVKLINLSGIAGANRRLAAMGVRAKIVTAMEEAKYVAALQPCEGQAAGTVRTITFDPASIPQRHVLLLAADRAAHLGYFSAAAKLGTAARTAAMPQPETGNTGAAYTPGTGNTGAGATALGRARALAASTPSTGNTGTGNTGTGSTGNGHELRAYCARAITWPTSGNTGNTG